MKKIKVLFLSMQPALALFTINFFSQDLAVKPESNHYIDGILKKELVNYDVIVLDDGSLNNTEIESLETFVKNNKNRKLLFTSRLDVDYINNFIDLGIEGILSKRVGLEKLREAVIAISNGEKYFGENIIKYIAHYKEIKKLTSREKEIIILIRNQFTNKEIAEKLFLSVKTVESHKENIKKKLNFKSVKNFYHLT